MPKRRTRKIVSLSVPRELRPMSYDDIGAESVRVETQILEPISSSSNSVSGVGITTFKLTKSGILQRDLRYKFTVTHGVAAVTGMHAFSFNSGALAVIDRIVLKTSTGQIIHDIPSCNFLSMIKQNFVPVDVQNNIDRAEMGNVNPYNFVPATVAVNDAGGALQVPDEEYRNSGVNDYNIQRSGFKTRVDSGSTWTVPLNKVLPVFQQETSFFPLYKMKDDLIIEIHKANKNDWYISASDVDGINQAPAALPASVQLTNEQLVMNTIHYPPKVLEAIEKTALNKSYPFLDYTLLRKSFGATPNNSSLGEQILRLGLQGRTLRSVYAIKSHPTDKNVWNGALYSCHQPNQQWNLKINDKQIFNTNVDNPVREHDLLEETHDAQANISLPLFSNNTQLANVSLVKHTQGIGNKSDLAGRMNLLGVDFRLVPDDNVIDGNGLRIGTAPCEFRLNYDSTTAQDEDSDKTVDLKLFFCYARSYSLAQDGSLITSY